MLNTLSHGSAVPDHMLSLKKLFVLMLFCKLDPKNGNFKGKRYVLENITNNVILLQIPAGMREGA